MPGRQGFVGKEGRRSRKGTTRRWFAPRREQETASDRRHFAPGRLATPLNYLASSWVWKPAGEDTSDRTADQHIRDNRQNRADQQRLSGKNQAMNDQCVDYVQNNR